MILQRPPLELIHTFRPERPVQPVNNELLQAMLPATRGPALLFGLMHESNRQSVLLSENLQGHHWSVTTYSSDFTRLDVIRIDEMNAGTIVSLLLAEGLLHMSGLFVREAFRSNKIAQTLGLSNNVPSSFPTPSRLLLRALISDLVNKRMQMSLEVMNNNRSAIRLYEERFKVPHHSSDIGFQMMNEREIESYSRLRGKSIKGWHEVDSDTSSANGTGVQWRHVPNYNDSLRWSLTRIYHFVPPGDLPRILSPARGAQYYAKAAKALTSRSSPLSLLRLYCTGGL